MKTSTLVTVGAALCVGLVGISAAVADEWGVKLEIQLGESAAGTDIQAATTSADTAGQDGGVTMDVLSSEPVSQQPPRQRDPQLSEDHIVVIAVDSTGNEITRQIILDPRLLRSEFDESGGLGNRQDILIDDVSFSVELTADPDISELKLMKPEWNGKEFVLNLLASAPVSTDK
jgi:hypothetical protein